MYGYPVSVICLFLRLMSGLSCGCLNRSGPRSLGLRSVEGSRAGSKAVSITQPRAAGGRGKNPARWRGHLENLLPKKTKVRRVEHHAALPYAEIGAFMAELWQQEGIVARALEFAILTWARTGEVIGAAGMKSTSPSGYGPSRTSA